LKSKLNGIAMRKGIDNLKQNIVQIMLFCKQLKKVTINDHGKKLIFESKYSHKIEKDISLIIISCKQGKNQLLSNRRFLSISTNNFNQILTEKFEKERELRLTIGIGLEIDENNNIIEQGKETPSHFCVFL
jgi:predicted component of type VI protein secretion system